MDNSDNEYSYFVCFQDEKGRLVRIKKDGEIIQTDHSKNNPNSEADQQARIEKKKNDLKIKQKSNQLLNKSQLNYEDFQDGQEQLQQKNMGESIDGKADINNQISEEEWKIIIQSSEELQNLPLLDIFNQQKILIENIQAVKNLSNQEQQFKQQQIQEQEQSQQFIQSQSQSQSQQYIEITFKKTIETAEDNLECLICSQNYNDGDTLALLMCIHRFHLCCFKQWYEKSKTCPYCQNIN